MTLKTIYATKNECYQCDKKIVVQGIVMHSTGANNPYLWRYVQPDDGVIGVNKNNNSFNEFRPGGRQICPHAVIGKIYTSLDISTYQILPWDHRGWHVGTGFKGSYNNSHIGFEICEDDLTDPKYFWKCMTEAAELCAYLCKKFNLTADTIVSHKEAHAAGYGTNHGDPEHWMSKFGYSMQKFRADVDLLLKNNKIETDSQYLYKIQCGAFASKTNAENCLADIKKKYPELKDCFVTKVLK